MTYEQKFHPYTLFSSLVTKANQEYLALLKDLLVGRTIRALVNHEGWAGHPWKTIRLDVTEVVYNSGNGEFSVRHSDGKLYVIHMETMVAIL